MKYLFFYIIPLLAFLNISCSQRQIVITEDQVPDDIFYLQDEIHPYTGECVIYYKNTEHLKEVMTFKNGLLDGPRISYYIDGSIKCKGYYSNGNLDGKWRGYDKKGKMIYEVQYRNDTLIGKFISWYSTGVIKEKGKYEQNKKAGEWVSYDEAGMVLKKTNL
jgi:antitoxin component YwqK of YwqJK toxin-antitoxin module